MIFLSEAFTLGIAFLLSFVLASIIVYCVMAAVDFQYLKLYLKCYKAVKQRKYKVVYKRFTSFDFEYNYKQFPSEKTEISHRMKLHTPYPVLVINEEWEIHLREPYDNDVEYVHDPRPFFPHFHRHNPNFPDYEFAAKKRVVPMSVEEKFFFIDRPVVNMYKRWRDLVSNELSTYRKILEL